jgi:hypothetical protein
MHPSDNLKLKLRENHGQSLQPAITRTAGEFQMLLHEILAYAAAIRTADPYAFAHRQ